MNQSSPFRPSSLNAASKLGVNPQALWKVTLGFIPAFVNLQKRLYGPEKEEFYDDEDESTCYSKERYSFSIEVAKDAPDLASVSDISESSSGSEYSSCTSGYSEYTSASSGWSSADPDLNEYSSSYTSSFSSICDSKSRAATSASNYSGSFYDFARMKKTAGVQHENNAKKAATVTKRWVNKFSRVFRGGSVDCNHTV